MADKLVVYKSQKGSSWCVTYKGNTIPPYRWPACEHAYLFRSFRDALNAALGIAWKNEYLEPR